MPLQVAPPDTSAYMIAGYVVFAVIMGIYLASFVIRHRNLQRDLQTLESIQAENRAPAAQRPPAAKGAATHRASRPTAGRAKAARKRIPRKR